MQQIKLVLLRADYVFGVSVIIFQIINRHSLASAFFYGTFIISLLLWIFTLFDRFDRADMLVILIVVLALMNVTLNGISEGVHFSFDYMKKYIMFCCTIIFFAAARKIAIDNLTFRFLEYIFIAVGMIMSFMYLRQNAGMHIMNGYYTQYLTFRFTNPNLTALFLSSMIMFMVVAAFREDHTATKYVLFLMAAVEMMFLYQTLSRNSLLATTVFIALTIILFVLKKDVRLRSWMLWILILAPLIIAIVYLLLVNNNTFLKVFSFIVSEGKNLDSRVGIWRRAIPMFVESPIIGAYYAISRGTGISQMHNTHIDVLASYGLVVFGLVCAFLHHVMSDMQSGKTTHTKTVALIAFVCVLLLGVGEAAMFSGGMGIYLFFGVFLLLTNGHQRDEEYSENSFYK